MGIWADRFPQVFLGLTVLGVALAAGASALGDGLRDGGAQDEEVKIDSKLRPELLAAASEDATTRGRRLISAAGGRMGRLRNVSAGVFQITAPGATDTSSEGMYDTCTIEKDVTAVVRLTFGLA